MAAQELENKHLCKPLLNVNPLRILCNLLIQDSRAKSRSTFQIN